MEGNEYFGQGMWTAAVEKTEIFEKFCIGRDDKIGVTIAWERPQLFMPLA